MNPLKLFPIGVQTFKNMRDGNYVYVDKTESIFRLVRDYGAYFLSRPRRFGKSLTVSVIKELFEGNRTLFQGLWIEDKWDWSIKNPVIHISFALADYQGLGLEAAIQRELVKIATQFNLILEGTELKSQFEFLLKKLHELHGKVVFLVDEYDKPIIDYLSHDQIEQAKNNQQIMKSFYSVLMDSEPYLRLVFITGVSKFSKVSIFSDINHLRDLTMHREYSTLTGYTQTELEENFAEHLEAVGNQLGLPRPQLLAAMKEWYNGFSWDGENRLYNPFGILGFFDEKSFKNFWFKTATPTFLINLIKEKGIFKYESEWIPYLSLEKYDLDNLEMVPLLFQTGYLTVKEIDRFSGDIMLDYPNREVRDGMYQFLLDDLTRNQYSYSSGTTVTDLGKALKNNDLDKVKNIIDAFFADLPSVLFEADPSDKKKELELSERFFHSIIHLVFKYLGIHIQSEVNTSFGRADSIVTTATHIYIFEFKYNKSGKTAFNQIIKKNYAETYRNSGKILIGIGVNFNHVSRRINGWVAKNL